MQAGSLSDEMNRLSTRRIFARTGMIVPSENADFNSGLDLFNRAQFFEAHEALEDAWRSVAREPLRRHIQGIVQLAVAFHHESTGNHVGARSVLERGLGNLSGADSSFPDLDFEQLRADLTPWRRYLDDCGIAPDKENDARDVHVPKIHVSKLHVRKLHVPKPSALPKIVPR